MTSEHSAENESRRPGGLSRATRFLPAATLSGTFLAMLAFSWGKWPDVLVDFGHELYTPWQLSLGKVLGRDIAWGATGPLSPYANALLFSVFGTGLRTLVVANLVVLAALTALLFFLLREIGDRFAATLACLAFLTIFAFGQYVGIGNYNYVTPYSHGVTHGLLLASLTLLFLWRHARTRAIRDLAAATTSLGLVFLTKPEIFVATACAVAVGALLLLRDAPGLRARIRILLALALPPLAPASVAFAVLAAKADLAAAWHATFAPWLGMASPLTRTPFYLSGLGLDDPAGNILHAAIWLAGYVAVFGAAAFVDWRARSARTPWIAAACAAVVFAAGAWALVPGPSWLQVARPLPALAAIGCLAAVLAAWRMRPCTPAALLHAAVSVFSALLLLKMLLNARLYHYGFALAMPATLLLITWLGASVPRLLRTHGATGAVFRAVTAAIVVVVASVYVQASARVYARKTEPVGAGPDAFLADGRGAFVNAAVQALSQEHGRAASLAVIPEGVMINYLARLENPSPYLTYLPDALAFRGERRLLEGLRDAPPALVLVVYRDASEHGAMLFGRDYALDTRRWLQERYEPAGGAGGSPFEPGRYGMRLFRLKSVPGSEHAGSAPR